MSIGTTNDFQNAIVYHWLHDAQSPSSVTESGILESMRTPLESRTYYFYPGQSAGHAFATGISLRTPCVIARVVDNPNDPTHPLTQAWQYSYNSQGKITQSIDPVGRQTTYNYYANGVDLQNIQQSNGVSSDILAQFGTYTSAHRPTTYTNAAGMGYSYSWNPTNGQLTQATDPRGDFVNYNYNDTNYLKSVIRSGGGLSATNSFGYDFYGRVDATTNAEGYYETYNYDKLNRLTQVTHPDGTSEKYVYNKLNLFAVYDRAGYRTVWTYDQTGRPLTMRDR